MSDSTPVKNGLIPAGLVWFIGVYRLSNSQGHIKAVKWWWWNQFSGGGNQSTRRKPPTYGNQGGEMMMMNYQGGEMMKMNSVFWWRKPEYQEETTCLMVSRQLHGMHSGGGSPFSKNSWVRRECPIRHLLKTDRSLQVFRWWVHGSLTLVRFREAISWSWLSGVSSHVFCHMVVMHLRMIGLKFEGVMRQGCMSVPRAVLAARYCSLPWMPTWPGSQQRWMSKPDALSDISSKRTSSIMGRSVLRRSSACRHDMESVKIKHLFLAPRMGGL